MTALARAARTMRGHGQLTPSRHRTMAIDPVTMAISVIVVATDAPTYENDGIRARFRMTFRTRPDADTRRSRPCSWPLTRTLDSALPKKMQVAAGARMDSATPAPWNWSNPGMAGITRHAVIA